MKFQLFFYFPNTLSSRSMPPTSWYSQSQAQEYFSAFSHYQNWSKRSAHGHEDFSYCAPWFFRTCCVQWLWLHTVWAAEKESSNTFIHLSRAYVACIGSFFIKTIMLLAEWLGWFTCPVQCGFFDVQ